MLILSSYVSYLECPNNTYGIDCIAQCGHCSNNKSCDPVTGICPDVCQAGWIDERCDMGMYCLCIFLLLKNIA